MACGNAMQIYILTKTSATQSASTTFEKIGFLHKSPGTYLICQTIDWTFIQVLDRVGAVSSSSLHVNLAFQECTKWEIRSNHMAGHIQT